MVSALPGALGIADDEAEVGLVDEGGGLEGLPRRLLGQAVGGELAQLVVDQRQQLLGSVRVALLDGRQDVGDITHVHLDR